jgi:hypothetical protein
VKQADNNSKTESEDIRPTILLESNNPLDVTPRDLDELARQIELTNERLLVEIGYDRQYGAGVTGHEVLIFWVPNADTLRDGLYVAAIQAALAWLKSRFKRRHSERRTKILMIYSSSTGDELVTWIVTDEESEPVAREPGADSVRRIQPKKRRKGRHRR